jgi:DNA end-binding protein Ku
MASTVWKGYITFGLISIPVRLFVAARGERVSFHQVHEPCDTRIKQQLYCPTCERVVERSELVKGHEVEKGRMVIVEEEEIKKVAPRSTDTMEIQEFVKLDDVDPLYFDMSYYAVPEDPGRKAYQLLLKTMNETGYAAIAKIGMHQREYVVVIRPRGKGLTLHTMHYEDEVREVPEYGKQGDVEVKSQEVELAKKLVESLATEFEPGKYKDEYQERLQQLIAAKGEGREVTAAPARKLAPVINLMEALQRSLDKEPKKPAGRAAETAASAKRASRKRPVKAATG